MSEVKQSSGVLDQAACLKFDQGSVRRSRWGPSQAGWTTRRRALGRGNTRSRPPEEPGYRGMCCLDIRERRRSIRPFYTIFWLCVLFSHIPPGTGYFLGDSKAVLTACGEYWTLQDHTFLPLLFQMTVCVHVRVVTPGSWVAFSYSSPRAPRPDLGLEGDGGALYGWLLGVRHRFPITLSPTQWHRVCLRRDVLGNSFSLEVDGSLAAERTVIAQAIPPAGTLRLGCRSRDLAMGNMIGQVELYMFGMWADLRVHEPCEDGSVIGWDSRLWGVTSGKARQRDVHLLCADHRRVKRDVGHIRSGRDLVLGKDFTFAPLEPATVLDVLTTLLPTVSNQAQNNTVSPASTVTTAPSTNQQTDPPTASIPPVKASTNHSSTYDPANTNSTPASPTSTSSLKDNGLTAGPEATPPSSPPPEPSSANLLSTATKTTPPSVSSTLPPMSSSTNQILARTDTTPPPALSTLLPTTRSANQISAVTETPPPLVSSAQPPTTRSANQVSTSTETTPAPQTSSLPPTSSSTNNISASLETTPPLALSTVPPTTRSANQISASTETPPPQISSTLPPTTGSTNNLLASTVTTPPPTSSTLPPRTSSANQIRTNHTTTLIETPHVSTTPPTQTMSTGSPQVHCNLTQLCSNQTAFYWVLIDVEATGANKSEADISNWVAGLFTTQACGLDLESASPSESPGSSPGESLLMCQGNTQGMEVTCDKKQDIRRSNCSVLLQLSHPVSVCSVKAALQRGGAGVQVTVLGEVQRVGRGLCMDTAPSNGGFVKCTSSSPLEEVCQTDTHTNLTCSLLDPGSRPEVKHVPLNQSCEGKMEQQTCDCSSLSNTTSLYVFSIQITSPEVTASHIETMMSTLAEDVPCHKLPQSLCEGYSLVSRLYEAIHLECHGTDISLDSCIIFLQLSESVPDICGLTNVIKFILNNNTDIMYDMPVTPIVLCGSPGLDVEALLMTHLTWGHTPLSYAQMYQSPLLLPCEKGETLVLLLTDSCLDPPPDPASTNPSPQPTATQPNSENATTSRNAPRTSVSPMDITTLTLANTTQPPATQTEASKINTTQTLTASTNRTTSTNSLFQSNTTGHRSTSTPGNTTATHNNTTTTPRNTTLQLHSTPSTPNTSTLPKTTANAGNVILHNTTTPDITKDNTGNATMTPNTTFHYSTTTQNKTVNNTATTPGNTATAGNITIHKTFPTLGNTTTTLDNSTVILGNTTRNLTTTFSDNSTLSRTTSTPDNITGTPVNTTITPSNIILQNTTLTFANTTATPSNVTIIPGNTTATPSNVILQNATFGNTTLYNTNYIPVNATIIPGNTTAGIHNTTIAPVNTTTSSGNTTATPSNTTFAPDNTTTSSANTTATTGNTTFAPDNTTTSSGNTTDTPSNTTFVPDNTTTSSANTTATPGNTTFPPGNKTSSGNTTATPGNTISSLGNTTATPSNTTLYNIIPTPGNATIIPGNTTATASNTTIAPGNTTAKPGYTTIAPANTTIAPGNTTATPGNTTFAPGNKTTSPGNTTAPPGNTTSSLGNTTATPSNIILQNTTLTFGNTTLYNSNPTPDNATVAPGNTTATAGNTTVAPVNTTTSSGNTTIASGNTTIALGNTTITPDNTTTSSGNTTIPPVDTTLHNTTFMPGNTTRHTTAPNNTTDSTTIPHSASISFNTTFYPSNATVTYTTDPPGNTIFNVNHTSTTISVTDNSSVTTTSQTSQNTMAVTADVISNPNTTADSRINTTTVDPSVSPTINNPVSSTEADISLSTTRRTTAVPTMNPNTTGQPVHNEETTLSKNASEPTGISTTPMIATADPTRATPAPTTTKTPPPSVTAPPTTTKTPPTIVTAPPTTTNTPAIIVTAPPPTTVSTTPSTATVPPTLDNAQEADQLSQMTQGRLNSSEVDRVVSRLEQLLQGPSVSKSVGQKVLTVISNLMAADPAALSASANRLINAVDTLGLKLDFDGNRGILLTDSLALAVTRMDGNNFQGASFSISSPSSLQVSAVGRSKRSVASMGSVTLPSSLTEGLSPQEQLLASRVQFTFYQNASLFQDRGLAERKVISPVLGSSVANLSISGLSENVTFTLRNTDPIGNDTASCVFWDFTLNDFAGGWNSTGCSVVNSTDEDTTCSCNHLTSFAILLDLSQHIDQGVRDKEQALILTFITYIGCGLSAIFLSVTLLTYLSFQKLRRDTPSKILIQLCLSLLLLNLLFLLDGWLALYPATGLCTSTAFFLHYFLLTSFTWTGLEALHMYLSIVRVFTPYLSRYMLKLSLLGWGLPLVVVIVVIAVDKDNYGMVTYGRYTDGSTDDFCWIRNATVFYVGVVAYFLLIFVLSVVVFIVVMVQLARVKKQNPQNVAPNRSVVADLRSIAGLIILLGLTWGFALFAWGDLYLPFIYLFTIFNSLQGFFIFVFHCAVKDSVRKQWRTFLCCGRLRLAENSDWSRTATHRVVQQSVTSATNVPLNSASRSSSLISDATNSSGSVFADSGISETSNRDVILNDIQTQQGQTSAPRGTYRSARWM